MYDYEIKYIEALQGKLVNKILVSKGEECLVFETDKGDVVWLTEGDCCSETWFADIIGVENVLGKVIQLVEPLKLPVVEDGRTRQDLDKFYGVRLKTASGEADIIYRNSSNGYYGGNLQFCDIRPPNKEFVEITQDWQA